MHWWIIGLIGIGVIALFFWFISDRKQKFDAPLLGLITIGLVFLGIATLQPPSIKYAGLELGILKEQAKEKIATLTAVENIVSLRIRAMRSKKAFEELRTLARGNSPQKELSLMSYEEVLDIYDGQRGKDIFETDFVVTVDGKQVNYSALPIAKKFDELSSGLRPSYVTNLVDKIVESQDKASIVEHSIRFLKKSDYLPGCMAAGISLERLFSDKKGMPQYHEFGEWIDMYNKGKLKP